MSQPETTNDWVKIFKFSKVVAENGKTYYQVHLKYNNKMIGHGTSPDVVGATSTAYNWFHNKANEKEVLEALFEYNILDK